MGLESATYINQLVDTNPLGSDVISQGDDHIKLIKEVLQSSFPDVVGQASATIIAAGSAPTSNVRGTIWYDTGNDLLKINTAVTGASATWVTVNAGAPWAAPASLAAGCMFRVGVGSTQAIANNTWTKVEFDTEEFDLGSDFNTSTYEFTAPATGKYYLHGGFRTSTTHSADDDMAIYKNSAAYAMHSTFRQAGGSYVVTSSTLPVSCIMDMSASDTASVYAHTEGGGYSIGNSSITQFFEGYRLV